jgi:hypothetical protein
MKHYYIGYSNGDCDFIKAQKDCTAYNKACKLAKEQYTSVKELHEISENEEIEEALRIIIHNGKEV